MSGRQLNEVTQRNPTMTDTIPPNLPLSFVHDPETGIIKLSNPTTREGLHLVRPPEVIVNEDIMIAIAMRVMSTWLDQRRVIDWRQFVQQPERSN